jgi:putative transposase
MKPTLSRELAIDALLMAVWRRKPQKTCAGTFGSR